MDTDYLRIPEQLVELATKLSYSSSSVDSMQVIVDFARSITNADSSVIFLFDKSSESFQLGARNPAQTVSVGLPRKNGLTSYIFNKDDGIFFTNDASREKIAETAMGYHQSRSFIGIRLEAKGDKFGVLYVRKSKENQFSLSHVNILRLLAAQIGLVFSGFSSYLSSSSLISQAVRRIYSSEDVFKEFCNGIMERWKFDYTAIQLIRRDKNAIETVHVSESQYNPNSLSISGLSRHSLSDKSIHDIQADIALSNTPLIMIVSGWYEKFDEWIYDENKHDEYIRIWLPLPIVRNSNREIVNSECEWHTNIYRNAEVCIDNRTQRAGKVTEITKEYYLKSQQQDISTEIIGTVDCGYRVRNANITVDDAEELFRYITNHCVSIYQITLQHVLESIASQACAVVNASSASLHYPFDSNVFSNPYVVSAGKGVGDFLTRCKPRPDGMGFLSIKEGNQVFWNNLKQKNPNVYSEGIRSIAAFPLKASNLSGVLYLHYKDERNSLSNNETKTVEDFVSKAEDAIDQAFHYLDLLDSKRVLNFLHNIDSALLVDPASDNLLSRISGITQNLLAADVVNIYEYDAVADKFEYPAIGGQLYTEWEPSTGVGPNSPARLLLNHGKDVYEPDHNKPTYKSILNSSDKVTGGETFVNREKIISTYGSLLKVADECVGVMFINFRRPVEFAMQTKEVIRMLASSAAIAIKTKQSFQNLDLVLERQKKEKRALHSIDLAIKEHKDDLDAVLNLVLEKALEITDANSGSIVWHNKLLNLLEVRNSIGLPESAIGHKQHFGEGIVGICAETLKSILVSDVKSGELASKYLNVVVDTRSEIAIPLQDDNGLIAVLNLEHTDPYAFTNDEKLMIESFANQAVIAIHTTELFKEQEQLYQSIDTLRIVLTRLQKMDMSLLAMIRSILTGVTANYGLGYSRAFVFLLDKEKERLNGYTAIGAMTKKEADAIWKSVAFDGYNLHGRYEIEWLLDKTYEFCAFVEKGGEDSPLCQSFNRLSIQLSNLNGAIPRCLNYRKSTTVDSATYDPIRDIFKEVSIGLDGCAFACVPIFVNENTPLGVLIVDRCFLYSERDEKFDTKSLELYAGVAAMAFDNSILKEITISEKELNDFRTSTHKAAHVLGNSISPLDNAADKLKDLVGKLNCSKDDKRIILNQHLAIYERIEEMKKTLEMFMKFASTTEYNRETFKLKEMLTKLLNESSYEAERQGCLIELDMNNDILICGDRLEIFNVFAELIRNSLISINKKKKRQPSNGVDKGQIKIKAYTAFKSNKSYACIEIEDNGIGVPNSKKNEIFKPYFSRRGSAGLGLAIVRDAITAHGGEIEESGIEGETAKFKIIIPC